MAKSSKTRPPWKKVLSRKEPLLLPAAHDYGAHVDFHSQGLDRCQRTLDLLTPGSAFAGYICFLRPAF